MHRHSCRSFDRRIPLDQELTTIATAGLAAPSGRNQQPWRIILVKDQVLIRELAQEGLQNLAVNNPELHETILSRGGGLFYGAPCLYIVSIDPANNFSGCNCGIVCQNMALAAASLGLGSVICATAGQAFAGSRKAEFAQRLHFPQGYTFGMALLVGHPTKLGTPHELDPGKFICIQAE